MADWFVTNWGNIENSGLTELTPKRSIQSVLDLIGSGEKVYSQGWYNESLVIRNTTSNLPTLYGNNLTLDGLGILLYGINVISNYGRYNLNNIKIQNYSIAFRVGYYCMHTFVKIIVRNCEKILLYAPANNAPQGYIYNCELSNISNVVDRPIIKNNNTFYQVRKINLTGSSNKYNDKDNIFSEVQEIAIAFKPYYSYSLFHNCAFKFTGGGQGTDESEYAYPIGANDDEKLQNLRDRCVAVHGGIALEYFPYCRYQTDGDLFVDAANNDFRLIKGCMASKMNYQGNYVGKYPEAQDVSFPTLFESYNNLDATGNVIDQTVNATAETSIIDCGKNRHISGFYGRGERAIRNGNELNSDSNLSEPINSGTPMVADKTYVVRDEAITLNFTGKVLEVGDTFIANAIDGLDFAAFTGYVQEVFTTQKRSIEVKASKLDPTLTNAIWCKYTLDEEPRCNIDENGIITHGNLDVGYDEATSERLFARYFKIKATIQAQNLQG